MSRSSHHIRSHTLDLHYHGAADGAWLRSEAEQWQRTVWMPMLGRLLDDLGPGVQTVVLDRLEVDIDDLTPDNWHTGSGNAALQKLEEAVRQKLAASLGRTLPAQHRALDAAIHYLLTGALPWWSPAALRTDPGAWLRQWVLDTPKADLAEEAPALLATAAARTRLAAEVYDESFWKLVRAIAAGSDAAVWQQAYLECKAALYAAGVAVGSFSASCRAAVLGSALRMRRQGSAGPHLIGELASLLEADTQRLLQPLLDQLIGMNGPQHPTHTAGAFSGKEQQAEEAAEPMSGAAAEAMLPDSLTGTLSADALLFSDAVLDSGSRDLEAHHYIAGAGAVLLAPFLPQLFSNLGWADGKVLKQADKAAVMVHYLVWGRDDYHEWELLLPKLLCGLPLEALVPSGAVQLAGDERTAADELLQSAIAHWAVLKSTSPDGLRDAFLQREGRLTEKAGAWRLLVQPAAHDVLLQHLPWTFGIARLPWMEEPLYVDWE